MQISISVNDALVNEVLAVSDFKNKEEAIEQGLKLLLQLKRQEKNQAATQVFYNECRRQSLQLKKDANEKATQDWLNAVADTEEWQ